MEKAKTLSGIILGAFFMAMGFSSVACADQLTAPVTVKGTFGNMSTAVTVTESGRVGIGTSFPLSQLHVTEQILTVPRGIVSAQHNDGRHGANIVLMKSRGTENSPQSLIFATDPATGGKRGDYIGGLTALGYNGLGYERSAQMHFVIDEPPTPDPANPGANLNPTGLVFHVGPGTAPMMIEAMRITSSGKIGIGTDNPTALLEVKNGGIRINNTTPPAPGSCGQNTRGTIMISEVTNGGKTHDTVQVCLLLNSSTQEYGWRTVVDAGNNEHGKDVNGEIIHKTSN